MTTEDRPRFVVAMTALAEIFGEQLSPSRLELYFQALEDFEIDEIEAGVKECMRTCRFWPKPVEIIEAIEGSTDERGELAWMAVRKVIRGEARLQVVMRSDPAITPAVHSVFGSWLSAQQVETADLAFRRRDFLTAYRVMSRRQRLEPSPVLALVAPERPCRELTTQGGPSGIREIPQALEPPAAPSRQEIKAMVARVAELPPPADRWPKSRPERIKAQVEALKAKYPDDVEKR